MIGLIACASEEAPEAPPLTREQAADEVVFASTQALGAYTMHATIRVEDTLPELPPQIGEQVVSLRWKDDDHWAFALTRDGRVRAESMVWDGAGFRGEGGKVERVADAEPLRVQLASSWDPWALAFESVRDQLRIVPGDVGTYEGRRAVPHALEVVPLDKKARRGWIVEAASGEVWLDELTALRVKAEVHVRATSGRHTRVTTLSLAVTGIGTDPVIDPPAP
ncbi:MAG: hypothetical protein ACOZNI_37305 [Myxococcota bacterium]